MKSIEILWNSERFRGEIDADSDGLAPLLTRLPFVVIEPRSACGPLQGLSGAVAWMPRKARCSVARQGPEIGRLGLGILQDCGYDTGAELTVEQFIRFFRATERLVWSVDEDYNPARGMGRAFVSLFCMRAV